MRLAYCSPLRPQASGVSDYSEELLPHLARYFDLTLVTDHIVPTNPALAKFPRIEIDALTEHAQDFDGIVYHVGNAPLFENIYNAALRVPGVVVLHDVVLHHFRAWQTIEHGDRAGYIDAMREAYGEPGAVLAEREALGLEPLNRFEYPLSERVIRAARGVITHSEYAARFVQSTAPDVPVRVVPMGIPIEEVIDPQAARTRLGLSPNAFVISAFGEIHQNKRITVALEAFAEFYRAHAEARLLLIGSESPNYHVEHVLQTLAIANAVTRVGFVPMDTYNNYVAASDVCLNLRYPTAGESSASLLRLLAAGKPTFVTRTGSYAELPDAVCVKIEPDAHEKNLLVTYLEFFAAHPKAREVLGANARAFVLANHTLERAAEGYWEFLRTLKVEG